MSLKPLDLLIVGAHPDDPETCAGGLGSLAAQAGHRVIFLYLTDGQAGVRGVTGERAGHLRRQEAQYACSLLGVRPVFLGLLDGESNLNNDSLSLLSQAIENISPDIVLTHWPIDSHRDHRVCSSLVLDAWVRSKSHFSLFYMEALSGHQTTNFDPSVYLDISLVAQTKESACFAHESQELNSDSYHSGFGHGVMARRRGDEAGFGSAEAFVVQQGTAIDALDALFEDPSSLLFYPKHSSN